MKCRQSADIVVLSTALIVLAVAPFDVLLLSNTMDSPPSPIIESVYPEGDPGLEDSSTVSGVPALPSPSRSP